MSDVRVQRIDRNLASNSEGKKSLKSQKRSLSTDKKTAAASKLKQAKRKSDSRQSSKSRSRSSSRTRNQAAVKSSTLGAKVYIKKDMQSPSTSVEKQQFTPPPPVVSLPAKRNLRSASSTSSTGGESSVTTATVSSTTSQSSSEPFFLSTTSRYVKSIKPEVDLIATSTPQANQVQHVDTDQEATKSRYDLRKRISPSVDRLSPVRDSLTKSTTAQAQVQQQRQQRSLCTVMSNILNKVYTSGYLRFNLKQLFSIVIASILLLITLSIINYFNLFDRNYLSLASFQIVYKQITNFFYEKVCVNSKNAFNGLASIGRTFLGKFSS